MEPTSVPHDPGLFEEMYAALKAHDAYMLAAGYEGPESSSLHPEAAENWFRIRRIIARVEGK